MTIPPLNPEKTDLFVGCIQDVFRAYPRPESGKLQDDWERDVSDVLINLGAHYAPLELTEDMQREVDFLKESDRIMGLLIYVGLTDREIWLRANPNVVVDWMMPYLSEALGLELEKDTG